MEFSGFLQDFWMKKNTKWTYEVTCCKSYTQRSSLSMDVHMTRYNKRVIEKPFASNLNEHRNLKKNYYKKVVNFLCFCRPPEWMYEMYEKWLEIYGHKCERVYRLHPYILFSKSCAVTYTTVKLRNNIQDYHRSFKTKWLYKASRVKYKKTQLMSEFWLYEHIFWNTENAFRICFENTRLPQNNGCSYHG